jgi:hypothetical protein
MCAKVIATLVFIVLILPLAALSLALDGKCTLHWWLQASTRFCSILYAVCGHRSDEKNLGPHQGLLKSGFVRGLWRSFGKWQ